MIFVPGESPRAGSLPAIAEAIASAGEGRVARKLVHECRDEFR